MLSASKKDKIVNMILLSAGYSNCSLKKYIHISDKNLDCTIILIK